MRALLASTLTVASILVAPSVGSSGDKKSDKIAFDVYAKGYFVKNNAPLPGNPAYLILPSKKAYDQIFGFGAVMGGKPKLVTEKLFDDNVIIAVIKSGNTLWKYEVERVTREKGQLVLTYTANGKQSSSAKFNSPLILSVPRGDFAEVVFIENGKQVGRQTLKK
jgi:hypothetical protein